MDPMLAPLLDSHPGLTGIRPLLGGEDAFAARLALVADGVVPAADAKVLRAKAEAGLDTYIPRIDEIERVTQHDVIAFTTAVAEKVGPDARWMHFGMTSSDVIDTAQALQMREACDVILADLAEQLDERAGRGEPSADPEAEHLWAAVKRWEEANPMLYLALLSLVTTMTMMTRWSKRLAGGQYERYGAPFEAFVFALLIAVASGCGDPGPRLVPVSGKVTLDGVPLAHKTIQFIPETGTPGSGAGATSSADGAYELIATRGGALVDHKGACPGTYKVVVVEPMFPPEVKKLARFVTLNPSALTITCTSSLILNLFDIEASMLM